MSTGDDPAPPSNRPRRPPPQAEQPPQQPSSPRQHHSTGIVVEVHGTAGKNNNKKNNNNNNANSNDNIFASVETAASSNANLSAISAARIILYRARLLAARTIINFLSRRWRIRCAVAFERWRGMVSGMQLRDKLQGSVVTYTKRRLLLTFTRRLHRARLWGAFTKWNRMSAEAKSSELGANKQGREDATRTIVGYFRGFRKNQMRAALQELHKVVTDARASEASAEYGEMLARLQNQLVSIDAVSKRQTLLIKDHQTTIAHATEVAQRKRDLGAQRLKMRIARQLRNRALEDQFLRWAREFVQDRKFIRRVVVHRVLVKVRAAMASAFGHLQTLTVDWHSKSGLIRRRWRLLPRTVAFNAWKERWSTRKIQRHKVRITLARFTKRQLSVGFCSWRDETTRKLHNKYVITRAMARLARRTQARSMQAWRHWLQSKQLFAALAGKSFHASSRAQTRSLASRFRYWLYLTNDVARRSRKVEAALNRMKASTLTKGFFTWKSRVLRAKQARAIGKQCVARIRHRRMFVITRAWSRWAQSRAHQRRMMNRALRIILAKMLFSGWSLWRLQIERLRIAAATSSALERNVVVAGKNLAGIVARMLKRRLGTAWQTWAVGFVKNEKRLEHLQSHLMGKWQSRKARAVWARWHECVHEAKHMRRLVAMAIGRIQHLKMNSAFSALESNARHRAFLRRFISHCAKQVERSRKHHGFQALLHFTMQYKILIAEGLASQVKFRETAMSAFRRLENAASARLRTGFVEWIWWVQEDRRRKALMSRHMARFRQRRLSQAMHTWLFKVQETKRHRHLVAQVLAHARNRKMSMCWKRLEIVAENRRRARHLVLIIAQRHARASMRFALGVLHMHCLLSREDIMESQSSGEARRRRDAMVRQIMRRQATKSLRHALRQLDATARIMRRGEAKAAVFLGKGRLRSLHRCFSSWWSLCKAERTRERILSRAVKRMQHRRASAMLQGWLAFMDRREELRHVVKRIVHSYQRRERLMLARSIGRWSLHGAQMSVLRASMQLEERALRSSHNVGAHLIFKYIFGHIRKMMQSSMRVWSVHAKRAAYIERQARLILRRVQLSLQARAFAGWQRFVAEIIGIRIRMKRFIHRMQRTCLLRTFSGWHSRTKQLQTMRYRTNRAMKHWKLASEARTFKNWLALCEQGAHFRARAVALRTLVRHLETQEVRKVINSWKDFVFAQLQEEQRKQQREHAAKVIAMRWRRRNINAAMGSWVFYVEERLRLRAVLKRATLTFQHRHARAALTSWRNEVDLRQEQRFWLEKLCAKLKYRAERHAIGKLRAHVHDARLADQKLRIDAREKGYGARVIVRCLNRMQRSHCVAAIKTWTDFVSLHQRVERHQRKSLAKMCRRQTVHCFERWAGEVARMHRYRALVPRRLHRIKTKILRRCFMAWARLASRVAKIQASARGLDNATRSETLSGFEARCRRMALQKIIHMLTHRLLWGGFNGWRHKAATRTHQIKTQRTALAHWQLHKARRALSQWIAFKKVLQFAKKMGRRIVHRRLYLVWRRWTHDFVHCRKKRRMLLRALLLAKTHAARALVLGIWHRHAEERKQREFLRVRAAKHWRNQKISAAFVWWRQVARRTREDRRRVDRCLRRISQRVVSSAFGQWTSFAKHAAEGKRAILHLLRAKVKATRQHALRRWKRNHDKLRDYAFKQRRAMSFFRSGETRTLRRSFNALELHWKERLRMKGRCNQILMRAMASRKMNAFHDWVQQTRRIHEHRDLLVRVWVHRHQRMLRASLLQWQDRACNILSVVEARFLKSIHKQRRYALMHAVETWKTVLQRTRSDRARLKRAVQVLRTNVVSRVFRAWHKHTWRSVRIMERLGKVCQMIGIKYKGQSARAFRLWSAVTLENSMLRRFQLEALRLKEIADRTITLDHQSEMWHLELFRRSRQHRSAVVHFNAWHRWVGRRRRMVNKSIQLMQRLYVLRTAQYWQAWAMKLHRRKRARFLLILFASRVRRNNLQQAFSLFLIHSSHRVSGAPRYVIQQLEASFEKNIYASAIAKIHVQDVAVSLLTRQYSRKVMTYRFYKWVQWVREHRIPRVVGEHIDEEAKHYFDTSVSSGEEEEGMGFEVVEGSSSIDTKEAHGGSRGARGASSAMEQDS
jgi:hypothetical protein